MCTAVRSAELARRAGRHAAAGGLLRRVAGLLLRVVGIGGGAGVAAAEEEDVVVGSGGGVQRAAARVGSGTDTDVCRMERKSRQMRRTSTSIFKIKATVLGPKLLLAMGCVKLGN